MSRLMDLSDTDRSTMHGILSDLGGYVAMYGEETMTVAIPVNWATYLAAINAAGYRTDGTLTYFPLGSDKPDASLRHWGPNTAIAPRGPVPSYWCYVRVYPKDPHADVRQAMKATVRHE